MDSKMEEHQQGQCAKCGKQRERGNNMIWCHVCTARERETHALRLSR